MKTVIQQFIKTPRTDSDGSQTVKECNVLKMYIKDAIKNMK